MQVINPQAAGIDIGSTEHWVCVPPGSAPPEKRVRRFGAFTEQLDELWGWLRSCQVNTQAGGPKAMTATARKLACLIYHLLKTKEPYVEPEVAKYLDRFQKQRFVSLGRQAKTLGFQLVPLQPLTN